MEKRNLKYINRDLLGQESIYDIFRQLFSGQINSLDNESEFSEIVFEDNS